jgi:hypothetical protein
MVPETRPARLEPDKSFLRPHRKGGVWFFLYPAGLLLTGCSRAPSVDIIGSFFPGWLICLAAAVVLTFAVRFVLLKLRLESEVGPLALFYPSLLTLLTSALWLIYFR